MRKGVLDVWEKNHQNMCPWGNVHIAEETQQRIPLGKMALAQQEFHRDK